MHAPEAPTAARARAAVPHRRGGLPCLALLGVLGLLAPLGAHAAEVNRAVRHGYVDNRYGQLHYTISTPVGVPRSQRKTPIAMIPQTVNSSIESPGLFAELARDRVVIAIDAPGYGSSDGPDSVITIEEYAAAIAEGLRGLGYGPSRRIDVIGLHTGSLIAAELAIAEPRTVRRAALSGVYVVPEERWKKAIASLPRYQTSDEFFAWFVEWLPRLRQFAEKSGVPDADWGRIMAESLRPLVRREYAHDAAFTYAGRARERLPRVTQPVLLLAVGDGLGQPTLDSQPLFHDVRVVELPQYKDGAYFPDVGPMAAALRNFLD
jgi:pimeloyl-ACP methyl ester carboxylesterase